MLSQNQPAKNKLLNLFGFRRYSPLAKYIRLGPQENSTKDPKDEETETLEQKLTFNITYYPVFQNLTDILHGVHLLLAPDKEYKKVFLNVTVVGFRNSKNFKD